MVEPVKIKDKIIGEGHPILVIAEIAASHQGNVENVCDLVDIAVKANVDAFQIQVFKMTAYMSPIHKDWDLGLQLELSQDEWSRVIKLVRKHDILLFAAGYDVESVKFLIDKDIDAFKVHSSDISNPELLIEVAKSKKPIFLGCGASKIEEIEKAVKILKNNGIKSIILMHGYQAFPTKIEESNLKYIRKLERLFDLNAGFYDHVEGSSDLAKLIPIMAIGYGAQVIEKHLILTREEKGIDYESSLDPENFIIFSNLLRECEKAIGTDEIRSFTKDELTYRAYCKKSIVAKTNISKGMKITRNHVMFVRSMPGIPPDEFKKIESKIAKRDIKQFQNLTYDDF